MQFRDSLQIDIPDRKGTMIHVRTQIDRMERHALGTTLTMVVLAHQRAECSAFTFVDSWIKGLSIASFRRFSLKAKEPISGQLNLEIKSAQMRIQRQMRAVLSAICLYRLEAAEKDILDGSDGPISSIPGIHIVYRDFVDNNNTASSKHL